MRFTAIHRALGLQPQELTWDILVRAVDERVKEEPDLDWKSEGYGPKKDWDELAKDVAAMANSGGGLIVLGVQDEHATSAALKLTTPLVLSDPEESAYRREIFSRTHPPVQDVSIQSLMGDTEDERAVAIHVPPSLDAPHLVYRDRTRMDEFVAPFRDGRATAFMRERQLEAAYRQRFARRNERDVDLLTLYEDAARVFDPTLRACIVAVAQPEQPRPAAVGRLDQKQVRAVFQFARDVLVDRLLLDRPVSVLTDCSLDNPRLGLRRHSAHGHYPQNDLKHQTGVVSMHDDGAISLTWAAGGFRDTDPFDVYSFMFERTAADLAALVAAASRELGLDSGFTLRLGITHPGDRPVRVQHQSDPHLSGYEASEPVRHFLPVQASLRGQPDDEDLLVVARDLALDCLSQAGVSRLTKIKTAAS